ncbi:MAG: tetratricopeptide repeat protein [Arcobacter sp.]|uniref:tetratricopeptide repeat protein n=1 Tax=Arcobacter sp. TaxID=1872629 RepID=UPI003C75622D
MKYLIKITILISLLVNIAYAQEVELKNSKYDITQCIKVKYTKEDIENYKKLINQGELQGYSCAGIYYMRQGDFKEAINYFNKGKEKGSIESYAQLGSLYSSFLHDDKKAVENYKVAANAGDGKSAHNLGVYYYKNFNYDEAYKWFMKSYETGDMNSLISIGLMYIDEKKYDEAINTFKKVGELGEPRGYRSLGILFIKNKDVKNDKEGIKYLKKCYEMGYGKCASSIGEYYEEDKKDYKKAEEWYKKGFNLKYKGAVQKLGLLYEKILKDYDKAIYWYEKGFNKLNCMNCAFNLAMLYNIDIKDYKKAEEWYKKAADLKDRGAMYNLAYMFEYDLKNKKNAIIWYKKAAKLGHEKAINKLNDLGVSYE